MHRAIALILLLTGFALQASAQPMRDVKVRSWAEDYFARYAARDDWPGFVALFADDLVFEDPLANMSLVSREEFKAFYHWPDPSFSKHPDYPQTLVLEDLIVQGNRSIGSGYFTPFKYQGFTYAEDEPMRFTIWLTWSDDGKITKQIDWIDYPDELLQAMHCRTP